MKKYGFTLSEVLVTLGIIGVVAALTVPSLMQNAQKRVLVTTLRKVHSELSQAIQNAMSDKYAVEISDAGIFKDQSSVQAFFQDYLKTSQINGKCATLKDGAEVCMNAQDNIDIDVNGSQGPGEGGRDQFRLAVTNDGDVVGYQSYGNVNGYHGGSHSAGTPNKENAFSRIVNDGWNMDY